MTAVTRLRIDGLHQAMKHHGITSNYALARLMGLNDSTVQRVTKGQCAPGERFIAALLLTLAPHTKFEDVFECIDTEQAAA